MVSIACENKSLYTATCRAREVKRILNLIAMFRGQLCKHDETSELVVSVLSPEITSVFHIDARLYICDMNLNTVAGGFPVGDALIAFVSQLVMDTLTRFYFVHLHICIFCLSHLLPSSSVTATIAINSLFCYTGKSSPPKVIAQDLLDVF